MCKNDLESLAVISLSPIVKKSFLMTPWVLAGFVSLPVSAVEIGDKLELSGLAEVIGSFTSNDIAVPDEDSSDIDLSKVELYLDVAVADGVSSNMTLKWEADDLFIDAATITMNISDALSVTGGRMGIPFGNFSTNLVSDPITKSIADTNEGALQLGFESGQISGSVYVYNGNAEITGDDDQISGVGANIDYKSEMEGSSVELAAGYISNIADSGPISEPATGTMESEVAGLSLFASWTSGPFNVIAEHIQSLDDFQTGALGYFGGEVAPSATNIEGAFDLGKGVTIAAAYQMTDEAHDLGLPETRMLVSVSKEVSEGATVAAEYLADDDYDNSGGGTGESSSTLSFQMLVEF